MSATEQIWRVPARLDEVPESGRQVHLVADESVRAAAARVAGVIAIPRLEAVLDLIRRGRDGLHVKGNVSATVRQSCVVTLEPIENEVDEAVDVAFAAQATRPGTETEIVVGTPEPPEPLVEGVADLGAIAIEFLLLGIDPYPRKSGAVFEAPATADIAAASPFAALGTLKPDRDR
jgi:hypothetical protein